MFPAALRPVLAITKGAARPRPGRALRTRSGLALSVPLPILPGLQRSARAARTAPAAVGRTAPCPGSVPLPPVACGRRFLLAVSDAFNAWFPALWSSSCAPSHSVRQPADPVQLLRPPVVGSPPWRWCSLCLWACASLGLW